MRIGGEDYNIISFSVELVMSAREIEAILERGNFTFRAMERAFCREHLVDMADHLTGTCGSVIEALQAAFPDMDEAVATSIDETNLCYLLADFAESCQGCGWWYEPAMLSCEHDVVGYCPSCTEDYCEHCRGE